MSSKSSTTIDKKLDAIGMQFDKVLSRRIRKYEAKLSAQDYEIVRLKRWINEIANKTGIKLTP